MLRLLLWDDTLFSDHIPLVPERFSSPLLGRAFQRLWEVHAAGKRPMIASLGEEFTQEETEHLTAVCQEPVSLSNAAQALKDYINVINEEAGTGGSPLGRCRKIQEQKERNTICLKKKY